MSDNTKLPKADTTCPVCEEGDLIDVSGLVDIESIKRSIILHISSCLICGSISANAEQVKANKKDMKLACK